MSGGVVGTRKMKVNARYIRGFICPDIAAIAAALSGENEEREITMNEKELKTLIRQTGEEVLDELNPVYKDLEDVPNCWKEQTAALLEAGVVNGGGVRDGPQSPQGNAPGRGCGCHVPRRPGESTIRARAGGKSLRPAFFGR